MLEVLCKASVTEWLVVLLISLITYSYVSKSPWKRLPPGPLSFPVIGSLPYLGRDTKASLAKLALKYGDVFTLYLGPTRTVVINGYDAIKEAFIAQSGEFDFRSTIWEDFTHRNGIVSASGDLWKETRRFLLRSLKDFGLGGRRMEIRIQEESEYMVAMLQNVCGQPYQISGLLKKGVSNIISVLLFGRRWEYDDPIYLEHIRVSDKVMSMVGMDNPVWTLTNLKYIPGDPFKYHQTLRLWEVLGKTYRSWIEDHQERVKQGEEPIDIIGLYLLAMNKKKEHNEHTTFNVGALEAMMKEVYLAGTDTSSGTLLWSLLQLIRNPNIQEKMQLEIDSVIGRARVPCMKDRTNMPYTEAFISEIQRWCDLLPFSVHHAADADRVFRGYTIPKDTIILMNLHSINWDPDIWPNPHVFDPERFLIQGVQQRKEHNLPFSLGKRQCLGEGLAKMELFVFLVHLLQTFSFSALPDKPLPSLEGVLGLTHQPPPFEMIIQPRN